MGDQYSLECAALFLHTTASQHHCHIETCLFSFYSRPSLRN
jgi:hypothetical protein